MRLQASMKRQNGHDNSRYPVFFFVMIERVAIEPSIKMNESVNPAKRTIHTILWLIYKNICIITSQSSYHTIFISILEFLVLVDFDENEICAEFCAEHQYCVEEWKSTSFTDLLTHFYEFRILCGLNHQLPTVWIRFTQMHSLLLFCFVLFHFNCYLSWMVGWFVTAVIFDNNSSWKASGVGRDSSFLTLMFVHLCVLFWLISPFGVENLL